MRNKERYIGLLDDMDRCEIRKDILDGKKEGFKITKNILNEKDGREIRKDMLDEKD